MTILSGDVIRATVSIDLVGLTIAQNVYHYLAGAGVNAAEITVQSGILANLLAAYQELNGHVGNGIVGTTIDFAKYDPASGTWNGIGDLPFNGFAPTASGERYAFGVAPVVRFEREGSGDQGRKFLPGFVEGSITHGELTAGALADLVSYATDVMTVVAVTGGNMLPGWWSVAATAFVAMSGTALINSRVGYQRRRKPGIGI